MDATGFSMITAFLAAAFALMTGLLLGEIAYGFIRRRSYATKAITANKHERIELQLKAGFSPFYNIAAWMLKYRAVEKALRGAEVLLAKRGFTVEKAAVLSLLIAASFLIGLAVGLVSWSFVCGIAVSLGIFVVIMGRLRAHFDRYLLSMREDVPEALRSMQVNFRAGLSLLQCLQQTSSEIGGPLGDLFDVAAKRLEMGASTTEALSALDGGTKVPELTFVAVALDVQHQSGGSIAPVLDAARESVEGELDLLRSLRVQTAQAQLSARIVTLMPFVLIALFSLMSPGFLSPFFSSLGGMAILVLALGMQLVGVLLVRRMLNIETG